LNFYFHAEKRENLGNASFSSFWKMGRFVMVGMHIEFGGFRRFLRDVFVRLFLVAFFRYWICLEMSMSTMPLPRPHVRFMGC